MSQHFWLQMRRGSVFTALRYTERAVATTSRLSVCNVEVSWSHRLEFFEK